MWAVRDFRTLGIKPFGKQRPFPKFSDESLREFEAAFSITLPDSYVQFLRFANGGTLELYQYNDPATGGIEGINDFYGLGSRAEDEKAGASGKWEYGNL
jgi:SMI1 / KNR4 family (SUKH-1)